MKCNPVFCFLTLVLLFFYGIQSMATSPNGTGSPNFVIIFIDDMGYGDISAQGATGWSTPNIDKMAAEGMRFTSFYAAQPVCTASRAGLLTGCYPNRLGISGAFFPTDSLGLNPNETTIAEMLKDKGYTTAAFGKWHVGHQTKFLPLQNGFDEYVGIPYSNDMWPLSHTGKKLPEGHRALQFPTLPVLEGNDVLFTIKTLKQQDTLTTLYTNRAVDFINRNAAAPFFLYLPHSMGHIPLGVSDKFRGKSDQGLYGDVMMEIDWSVGEIEKALEDNGISENTIVIFTTDNGPWLNFGNHAGTTGGLREGKSTSWEGGQRVPFVIKWPGIIPAGVVSNQLCCGIDILPSFAEISGATLPALKIDGKSIVSLWRGTETASPRDNVLFYYGRNNLNGVRKGNWKLVLPHTWKSYDGLPGKDGFPGKRVLKKLKEPALYNLMRDPGERYNVIVSNPTKVDEIMKIVKAARLELGDSNVGISKGFGTRVIGKN